jgi:RNA recognition motif-containing protein
MSLLSRKKELLAKLKKKNSKSETAELTSENKKITQNEAPTTSHDDIKRKLSKLREESEKLKQDIATSEELQPTKGSKKTFSFFSDKSKQEDEEEMLDQVEGEGEQEKTDNAIIKIRNLPDGFFETEITKFFAQIAPVVNVRVLRNSRTGRSRGRAFVQFTDPDIADMIAEELDYFFLMEKVIRVERYQANVETLFHPRTAELHLLENLNHRHRSQYKALANELYKRTAPQHKNKIEKIAKQRTKVLSKKQKKWLAKGIEYEFAKK